MFVLPVGDNANEIVPGLWLGNGRAALDEKFLREKNIKVIFNCTKDVPFHHSMKRCYRVPVDDNLQAQEIRNMELWSFEIVARLAKEYRSGLHVLVHCAAGMQRSAAVVAMFLIGTQRITAEQAMAYIQKKRPIAFMPMANFAPAIRGFEGAVQKFLMDQENS